MKNYLRTVIYQIKAESFEDAHEAWGEDGPELATAGRVEELDANDIIDENGDVDPGTG